MICQDRLGTNDRLSRQARDKRKETNQKTFHTQGCRQEAGGGFLPDAPHAHTQPKILRRGRGAARQGRTGAEEPLIFPTISL
eukprot:COSAG06_NODE_4567_length_4140_cov_2.536996_3_plen_82_part_00